MVVVVRGHQALGRGCAWPVGTPVSTSCSPNAGTAAATPSHPTASPISLLRIFIIYLERKGDTSRYYNEIYTRTSDLTSVLYHDSKTAGYLQIKEVPL